MQTLLDTSRGEHRFGHGLRDALGDLWSIVIAMLSGLAILPVALMALAWYLVCELGQTAWSNVAGRARHPSSFGHATGYAMRPRRPTVLRKSD